MMGSCPCSATCHTPSPGRRLDSDDRFQKVENVRMKTPRTALLCPSSCSMSPHSSASSLLSRRIQCRQGRHRRRPLTSNRHNCAFGRTCTPRSRHTPPIVDFTERGVLRGTLDSRARRAIGGWWVTTQKGLLYKCGQDLVMTQTMTSFHFFVVE